MYPILDDLIGKPFVNGGRGPDSYDCYGLAREVYKRFTGKELPDYVVSCEDASKINGLVDNNRPQWIKCNGIPPAPAMIVMHFGGNFCNHIGVYIGDNRFIHTAEKIGVSIDRLDSIHWKRRIEGIYVPAG